MLVRWWRKEETIERTKLYIYRVVKFLFIENKTLGSGIWNQNKDTYWLITIMNNLDVKKGVMEITTIKLQPFTYKRKIRRGNRSQKNILKNSNRIKNEEKTIENKKVEGENEICEDIETLGQEKTTSEDPENNEYGETVSKMFEDLFDLARENMDKMDKLGCKN